MHKNDIIKEVAEITGGTQKDTGIYLDAILETIKKGLKEEEKVTLIGFGTFSIGHSAARIGRNPQTGAEIKIAASKRVKFSVGKSLKDFVNDVKTVVAPTKKKK